MKKHFYNSVIRCWNRDCIGSHHWNHRLICGEFHDVFTFGGRSCVNRCFRSMHWAGKI
jgi:hypothetical protein